MLIIPALRLLGQNCFKFKASPGFTVISSLKRQKQAENKKLFFLVAKLKSRGSKSAPGLTHLTRGCVLCVMRILS